MPNDLGAAEQVRRHYEPRAQARPRRETAEAPAEVHVAQARAHLGAALLQVTENDDAVIVDHIKAALAALDRVEQVARVEREMGLRRG